MAGRRDLVVIGASAGGIEPLVEVLAGLADVEAGLLGVVHIGANPRTALPQIVSRRSGVPARLAAEGEAIRPGALLLAPPDRHLVVRPGTVGVVLGPKENRTRPAVDPLFRSAARSHGAGTIAVVLSGMLGDGAAGMLAVRRAGGYGIVQDPDDALFGGMPSAALELAGADAVLTAAEMGPALERLAAQEVSVEDHPDEPDIVELEPRALQRRTQEGDLTGLTCPECHGALWEETDGNIVSYRCRVGHAFSLEHLDEAQSDTVEDALWMAVRALEEQAALLNRSVRRLENGGPANRTTRRMRDRVTAVLDRAEVLRDVLAKRANAPSSEPAPERPSG